MCLFDHYKVPWLIGGDFYDILISTKKFRGRPINNNRADRYVECLIYCKLIYLDFKGSHHIWTNKRKHQHNY